jgi:hypothetical protein
MSTCRGLVKGHQDLPAGGQQNSPPVVAVVPASVELDGRHLRGAD